MLADLLLKEIEENFDTVRINFDIHFDDADGCYGAHDIYGIQSIVEEAQENAKDSLHATIYIRDNTQSYIYDYDVKNDTLIRSDEDAGELYQPLLKEDEWLKELEEESKEDKNKLNKHLFRQFLVSTIPLIISIGFFFIAGEEYADIALLALQLCFLFELISISSIVLKKIHPYRTGIQ